MARNESFRKVSTTLFTGRASDAGDWSGLLPDHKNLSNHYLYIVASGNVAPGAFEMHVIPDTEADLKNTVATGRYLDFLPVGLTSKDSDFLHFTGVIGGLHLRVSEAFDPGLTLSAVLTSYSNFRDRGKDEERFDYVSTTIFEDKDSTDLVDFSLRTPNHLNMPYHQLMIISDADVDVGSFEIRIIPDSDEQLETTVWTEKYLSFPNAWFANATTGGNKVSFIHWFGGVFRGIHLRAIQAQPPSGPVITPGLKLTAVLSSSSERFDQILHETVATNPVVDTHINDFDNPHQTSWDNLLNKPTSLLGDWPIIKEYIGPAETHTVAEDFQMLVWESFDIEGELIVDGQMVVLGDQPVLPPVGPEFTYSGDDLTQIDYDKGEQKIFTYNVGGDLERLDFIQDGVTYRKDFFYTGGGDLDYIDEYYV